MVTENMDQFSDKQRLTLSRPVARAGDLERAEAR